MNIKNILRIGCLGFMLFMCGCVNIYTRMPGTNGSITRCYQSTDMAACATLVAAFPQIMVPTDSGGFEWYNILTIPLLGVPFGVDTLCEGVLDTVFWPIDYLISDARAAL